MAGWGSRQRTTSRGEHSSIPIVSSQPPLWSAAAHRHSARDPRAFSAADRVKWQIGSGLRWIDRDCTIISEFRRQTSGYQGNHMFLQPLLHPMTARPFFVVNLLLSCMVLCAAGCQCNMGSSNQKLITFVVPDSYSGAFVVTEDPSGVTLDERASNCVIRIPKSGIAKVTSADAMREMRQWSAITSSGMTIPVYQSQDDQVALRGGGYAERSGHSARFEFFVGTLKDFEQFDFSQLRPHSAEDDAIK